MWISSRLPSICTPRVSSLVSTFPICRPLCVLSPNVITFRSTHVTLMLEILSLLHSPDHIKTLSRKVLQYNGLDRMVFGICPICLSTQKISAQHTRQSFVSTVSQVKAESLGLSKRIWNSISLVVSKSHSLALSKALQRRKAGSSLFKKSPMPSRMPTFLPRLHSN